jgi:hypothetical protein
VRPVLETARGPLSAARTCVWKCVSKPVTPKILVATTEQPRPEAKGQTGDDTAATDGVALFEALSRDDDLLDAVEAQGLQVQQPSRSQGALGIVFAQFPVDGVANQHLEMVHRPKTRGSQFAVPSIESKGSLALSTRGLKERGEPRCRDPRRSLPGVHRPRCYPCPWTPRTRLCSRSREQAPGALSCRSASILLGESSTAHGAFANSPTCRGVRGRGERAPEIDRDAVPLQLPDRRRDCRPRGLAGAPQVLGEQLLIDSHGERGPVVHDSSGAPGGGVAKRHHGRRRRRSARR